MPTATAPRTRRLTPTHRAAVGDLPRPTARLRRGSRPPATPRYPTHDDPPRRRPARRARRPDPRPAGAGPRAHRVQGRPADPVAGQSPRTLCACSPWPSPRPTVSRGPTPWPTRAMRSAHGTGTRACKAHSTCAARSRTCPTRCRRACARSGSWPPGSPTPAAPARARHRPPRRARPRARTPRRRPHRRLVRQPRGPAPGQAHRPRHTHQRCRRRRRGAPTCAARGRGLYRAQTHTKVDLAARAGITRRTLDAWLV